MRTVRLKHSMWAFWLGSPGSGSSGQCPGARPIQRSRGWSFPGRCPCGSTAAGHTSPPGDPSCGSVSNWAATRSPGSPVRAQPWLTSDPATGGTSSRFGTRRIVRRGMFRLRSQYTRQTRLWFQGRPSRRNRSKHFQNPKRARLEDVLQGLCGITILMLSMNQLIMAR